MRLKSLELFGFKSFVDRTVIQFESGITAVVGPNGAGKTNCVDAIRWVMGEQSAKRLRGAEMQDVIFNGTNVRPAVGMAQVILRFDLTDGKAPAGFTDYSEIEVERRLYRSGESEYAINKVPCRLRDVIDLFLGTGVGTKAYSIVEQGKIEQILSAKPEQRRLVIEEAAGVSKFKNRKEAALRRIESTQANLARLKDVIAEIKRQLNSLNRQARRAERYKKLYDELKEKELKLTAARFEKLSGQKEKLQADQIDREQDEAGLAARMAEAEAKIEEERLNLTAMEQELSDVQEKFYMRQNAVKLHETTLGYQTSKSRDLTRQLENAGQEVESVRQKQNKTGEEIDRLNQFQVQADVAAEQGREKIAQIEPDLQEASRVCGQWQGATEQTNKEILEGVGGVAETQAHFEYLEKRELELEGRIGQAQAEVDALDKRLKELDKRIARADQALQNCKQLSLKFQEEGSVLQRELNQKREVLQQASQQLDLQKGELATRASRLESLATIQKNWEGFAEGVRNVLQASDGKLEGVYGAVSDMIATEAQYEPAVSAVLGEKLQYVVVKSQKEGLSAVEYLKTQSLGRSTFIPLDVQVAGKSQAAVEAEGVLGSLTEKVRFKDDCQKIAQYLFGDCLLVEDLQKALNLWSVNHPQKTLVTLSGEVLDPAGVLSGGSGASTESLLRVKRHIEELTQEVAQWQTTVSRTETEVLDLREKIERLEERLQTIHRDHHGEEIRMVHQEKDSLHLAEEKARTHQERDRLSLEIARTLDEKRELESAREAAILELEKRLARQQELEKKLREDQQGLGQAAVKRDRLAEECLKEKARVAHLDEEAGRVALELEKAVQNKLEFQETLARKRLEIGEAQRQIENLKAGQITERQALETALKEKEILQRRQTELKTDYEAKARAVQEREAGLREERKQLQQFLSQKHDQELRLQEVGNQLAVLADQMMERYKVDISQYPVAIGSEIDWEAEGQAVVELKDQLEKLGSVHVGALAEYDELKERHDFLSKQEADLEKSLEDLKKAIQKINRISRERFFSIFEAVNAKFQEVFPRLFKGGRAKLILVDEQNLLETGVEIYAQPPGKKLQSITLLSGGEKALTAVALIFSIFLIKPSPFCLLDEVDAPLDDANIDRFNDQVRAMTAQSQFIIITHNKRTMERADCLYGVTMEEAGVSKVVSVRLNQEEALPKVA